MLYVVVFIVEVSTCNILRLRGVLLLGVDHAFVFHVLFPVAGRFVYVLVEPATEAFANGKFIFRRYK
jgi:hypothetical protein